MSPLQAILSFFAVWFLISVPASLFIGWFLSIRDCPDETKNEILHPLSETDYPEFKHLDEAS
jgi:hypothetical protein